MSENVIRKFRINLGLTQEELALKLGCYQHNVSKWERGLAVMSIKSANKLIKLAERNGIKLTMKKLGVE